MMKRRIIPVLISVIAIILAFPVVSYARLEGVDYSEINPTGSDVTIEVGGLIFNGYLTQNKVLSDEEKDKVIRQVMNQEKITSGMLLNAGSLIDAGYAELGLTRKDWIQSICDVTGIQSAVDLFNYVNKSLDPEDFIGEVKTEGQLAGDYLKGKALDWAKDTTFDAATNGGKAILGVGKTIGYKLLFLLPDIADAGLKLLAKYEKSRDTVALGLAKELQLKLFYEKCNKAIKEAAGNYGDYRIIFDNCYQTYNCTFWGIPGVLMEATFNGTLEKQQGSFLDKGGIYEGPVDLVIKAVDPKTDINGSFRTKNNFVIKKAIDSWKALPFKLTYSDQINNPTRIIRTMKGKMQVEIISYRGYQEPEIVGSFNSIKDELDFGFNHTVIGIGKYGNATYTLRIFVVGNSPEKIYAKADYDFEARGPHYSFFDDIMDVDGNFEGDVGTIWKPIEDKPRMIVESPR
ncbi:MAG: hypothetical protein Q4B67_00195 [Eubacteriales bacterium]|nr:hypothetical protein [Eubacteriales bacterium]